MSDDLTPREHADLRARLLTGTKRIKPVGKHRTAWVASTVAVVLVAGLAGGAYSVSNIFGSVDRGPITTPTPALSPSASPSRTPTPTSVPSPSVPSAPVPATVFGGDCDRVLSPAEVEATVGPGAALSDTAAHLVSDTASSYRLLGGVTCAWPGGERGYLSVTVLDAAAVTEEVSRAYAETRCAGMSGICSVGRLAGDIWIGAELYPEVDPWRDISEDALATVSVRLQELLDRVEVKIEPGTARATARQTPWWSQPDCEIVRASVEETLGEPMVSGFPGDSVPEGLAWDVLVAAGADQWCSSYSTTPYSSTIAEIYIQPGAESPSASTLAREDVHPIDLDGADAAWLQVDPQHPSDVALAAISGPNRLTVRFATGDDPTRVYEIASAVLAELG